MPIRPRRLWSACIQTFIVLLAAALVIVLILALFPVVLQRALLLLPIPGAIELPEPGPTPHAPWIDAAIDLPPSGYAAFTGSAEGVEFSCGFVMALDGGRQVGISAAHATRALPGSTPAQFTNPAGDVIVRLAGQIGRGNTFIGHRLTTDYVLWAVDSWSSPGGVFKPDPRGEGQPGEAVLVFSRFENGAGGSRSWPGVIMSNAADATWIQLEDSFNPAGFSGCPVASRHTGRLLGMAVAGDNKPPVVMGLHPVRSLVEKAEAALR